MIEASIPMVAAVNRITAAIYGEIVASIARRFHLVMSVFIRVFCAMPRKRRRTLVSARVKSLSSLAAARWLGGQEEMIVDFALDLVKARNGQEQAA